MGKLAFYPWLVVKEPVVCGDFSLLPYRRGKTPGTHAEEQDAIDKVLSPYRWPHGDSITRATVLQHSSQTSPTDPLDEELHSDLFVFSDLLAFVGLASRQFFGHLEYCNRDHYRLVLQAFSDPGRGALITTRRRDGSTHSFVTGDAYVVHRPHHVGNDKITLDVRLLDALLEAMKTDEWPMLYQALVLFGEANTDSSQVPVGTEVVLVYAALEQALGLPGSSPRELSSAFSTAMCPVQDLPRVYWATANSNPRAARLLEKAASLRAAWLQDLAHSRGSLAHGHSAEAYPAHWAPHEHLLLAAHALPLVVRRRLAAISGYELTTRDRAGIEAFEELANTDQFVEEPKHGKYPWRDVVGKHQMRASIRDIAERLDL